MAAMPTDGSVIDAHLCPDNEDWWSVELVAGDTVDVDLLFTHAAGDLAIDLTDSTPTMLTTADSSDDNETLSHTVDSAGTHYVKVHADPGVESDYGISGEVTSGTATCVECRFRPGVRRPPHHDG